jgi:HlyD family secretion protein
VEASVDESDVGRIRNGQKAAFTVDAFPGQTFDGEVRQVRKAAQNVANVVTYVAVVAFTNTGNRLLPGMTANVRLITDVRQDVLKVPNAAMRVRIAGVEPAAQGASGTSPSASAASQAAAAAASDTSNSATGGQGGGGQLAEFRNRLVTELKLSPEQQTKLDAIYAEARPKFATLRELASEERSKARERIMADTHAQIGELLTPDQKPKYAALLAEAGAASRAGTSTRGRIYLQGADGKPVAYNVRLGVSDGTSTELLVGANSPNTDVLKEGATVIIGTSSTGASGNGSGGQRPSGPRMPF